MPSIAIRLFWYDAALHLAGTAERPDLAWRRMLELGWHVSGMNAATT